MTDVERQVLSKVLRERDMAGLVEARVTASLFDDDEHLQVLAWMLDHFRTHGESPGVEAAGDRFPTWDVAKTPEPLGYYVERLRLRYRHDTLADGLSVAADLLTEDMHNTKEAERVIAAALADMSEAGAVLRDHNLADPAVFQEMFELYEELADNPGKMRGLATGWPTIDLATMGAQPGQLISLVGPPKGGKSTIMMSAADEIALAGHKVLFVTFEMSYSEMSARWIGKRAGINYRRLLKGRMNELDRKRLARLKNQLKKAKQTFVLSEDVSSTTTVSGIVAKLQEHKPEALFIDGVYLMDDENGEPKGSSQAITNITRSLKRVAQLFGIPVFISTQTLYSKMRGSSIKASSIGYSSSFGQDSDTVLAVETRENVDPLVLEVEHWIKVLLSRNGPLVEAQIDFDWATSQFTEFSGDYGDDEDDEDDEDDGKMRVGLRKVTAHA